MFTADEPMLDVLYSNLSIAHLVHLYHLEAHFVFKSCEAERVVDYVESTVPLRTLSPDQISVIALGYAFQTKKWLHLHINHRKLEGARF